MKLQMLKKALIIAGVAISIIVNIIILGSIGIDKIQQNARIDSQEVINQAITDASNRLVNAIVAGIEQNGEVSITIPDSNGGTKSLVLVLKGE